MKHFITRILMFAAFVLALSSTAMGQSKIQGIVNSISNDNPDITYSEKRDPKTKRITRSSLYLESKDQSLFNRLYKAIQSERANSVSYNQYGKDNLKIVFEQDGLSLTYGLYREKNGKWTLMCTTKPLDHASLDSLKKLEGLSGLSDLSRLSDLSQLSDISSSLSE